MRITSYSNMVGPRVKVYPHRIHSPGVKRDIEAIIVLWDNIVSS
jgi:hypothetical protein